MKCVCYIEKLSKKKSFHWVCLIKFQCFSIEKFSKTYVTWDHRVTNAIKMLTCSYTRELFVIKDQSKYICVHIYLAHYHDCCDQHHNFANASETCARYAYNKNSIWSLWVVMNDFLVSRKMHFKKAHHLLQLWTMETRKKKIYSFSMYTLNMFGWFEIHGNILRREKETDKTGNKKYIERYEQERCILCKMVLVWDEIERKARRWRQTKMNVNVRHTIIC